MSNYVVHFTRGGSRYNDFTTIMKIYGEGCLKPKGKFGIGRNFAPPGCNQQAVCFSEIPPGQWGRLVERRETKFGLAFSKEFLVNKGGCPIWYAWKGTKPSDALFSLMKKSMSDSNAEVWKLTPFIDSPGRYGSSIYEFDWEREWRYLGNFEFSPEDVSFLLIPEKHHNAAADFFHRCRAEGDLGPAYLCPYIDPSWSLQKIRNRLTP